MKRNPLKKTSCCPTGQRGVSAIGRIHPACRLFSQDFSRNTIVYLPVNCYNKKTYRMNFMISEGQASLPHRRMR